MMDPDHPGYSDEGYRNPAFEAKNSARRVGIRVAVQGITQSPMNPVRWYLSTACGHDGWVTSKRRPTAKTFVCHACSVPQ